VFIIIIIIISQSSSLSPANGAERTPAVSTPAVCEDSLLLPKFHDRRKNFQHDAAEGSNS
jgi:hypothetical protein